MIVLKVRRTSFSFNAATAAAKDLTSSPASTPSHRRPRTRSLFYIELQETQV
ncbi:hypothetical protein JHK87_002438 [Glycine soja]|nr:hypothetical protein JHK87_002438 [Glycine soja]